MELFRTPWGEINTILFDVNETIAYVWAVNGKGLMFINQPADRKDRERAFEWEGRWWIPGIMEK